MKRHGLIVTCALCCALLLSALTGCTTAGTAGKTPVAISVWHYYNGAQQKIFEQLVTEFNETVGRDQNIVVDAHSYGKIGDLTTKVLDAIHKEVGAEEVPDVFAAYADTAYQINQLGNVADISQYLTEEEQARYVSAYLDEGRFGEKGFQIFPIAKSTELLSLNKTEWDRFAAATGASEADLATWEGIAALAEQYYNWTDSLTPDVPNDGKAFFGRDAFANYIIIGSYQLGVELFQAENGRVKLNLDRDVMRRLWDNYYVPYISGCYAAYGKFRSDDLRTGEIAAFVGATSGATFFPAEVTGADGGTTPIEGAAYPLPNFAGTEPVAVQQGAGMVVAKSTPEKERAAVTFLKWFTQAKQNARFAAASGYLPVTYEANTEESLDEALSGTGGEAVTQVLRDSLAIGVNMTQQYTFYTNRPFEHGYEARQVCDTSMRNRAKEDRAAVEALIAGGMSRADAVARYHTDEHFDGWLEAFRQELEAAIAGH